MNIIRIKRIKFIPKRSICSKNIHFIKNLTSIYLASIQVFIIKISFII
nr:MAG TPA: hypothetical protein [Bacteriophage sp.]